MLDGTTLDEAARRLEVCEDGLVSFLHVHPLKVRNLLSEPSVLINRARHSFALGNDTRLEADAVIVLSKSRCLMNNASATIVRDISIKQHPVGSVLLLFNKVGEERLILEALEIRSLALLLNDIVCLLFVQLRDARLANDVPSLCLLVLDVAIVQGRVNAESQVAREGPGSGGPCDKRDGGISTNHRKCNDALGVRNILVVLTSLEVGQRGGASRRVGHDLVPPIDEILLKELLANPPDTLHVVEVKGLVVILHIDPPSHPPDDSFPLISIPHHNGSALSIVGLDAHLENVISRLDTKLLINLILYWKAVTVPPPLALHTIAIHVGVASHHILDRSRQNVAVVRHARCEGRAVVERIDRPVLISRHPQRLLKGIRLVPVLQYLLLRLGKLDVLRHVLHERRHGGAEREG
mmetsp:Transcript_48993/g.122469  ORF Transcript_48993/g.122469 Transcript_48993/m.122469 type:complete len:409 (+) Transcript_48993:2359-3585(+)